MSHANGMGNGNGNGNGNGMLILQCDVNHLGRGGSSSAFASRGPEIEPPFGSLLRSFFNSRAFLSGDFPLTGSCFEEVKKLDPRCINLDA